ncbi:hypothetical protein EJ06DRAFT_49852 [Trichodelitschia bisporula]|uniref:Uncharacterized protein n=1 Tax=Trichodelitschia bisporula TaxID=703511 RepID=A0A6G1HU78_9PEZI|nr:hypothetical protein EJ06DRAFT_49852 [Trichodelitschia bisporula]
MLLTSPFLKKSMFLTSPSLNNSMFWINWMSPLSRKTPLAYSHRLHTPRRRRALGQLGMILLSHPPTCPPFSLSWRLYEAFSQAQLLVRLFKNNKDETQTQRPLPEYALERLAGLSLHRSLRPGPQNNISGWNGGATNRQALPRPCGGAVTRLRMSSPAEGAPKLYLMEKSIMIHLLHNYFTDPDNPSFMILVPTGPQWPHAPV